MSDSHPIFSDRALAIVAEDKIRAAYARGEFDHLPGLGQPSPAIDEPYDEHWWIRAKLERESMPDAVRRALVDEQPGR